MNKLDLSAQNSRRRFLRDTTLASVALTKMNMASAAQEQDKKADTQLMSDPWGAAQKIVDRFAQPLVFRDQDYLITRYGAKQCELTQVAAWISFESQANLATPTKQSFDVYPAITAAIQACHQAGGGRVLIPQGNWYCAGPIVLLSNVHVHLQAGAHIYFSHQPDDYAKYGSIDCGEHGRLVISRWQSNDCLNYSPMVYAFGQTNIALTGEDWTSILDGQGECHLTPMVIVGGLGKANSARSIRLGKGKLPIS